MAGLQAEQVGAPGRILDAGGEPSGSPPPLSPPPPIPPTFPLPLPHSLFLYFSSSCLPRGGHIVPNPLPSRRSGLVNPPPLLSATYTMDAPVCPPCVPNPRTTGGASRGPARLVEVAARPLRTVGPMVQRRLQTQDFVLAHCALFFLSGLPAKPDRLRGGGGGGGGLTSLTPGDYCCKQVFQQVKVKPIGGGEPPGEPGTKEELTTPC